MMKDKQIAVSLEAFLALEKRVEELEKQIGGTKKRKPNTEISEEFKAHVKKFFDSIPYHDERLVLAKAFRTDEGTPVVSDFLVEDNWDNYENLMDAIGDEEAEAWFDTFLDFIKKEIKGYTLENAVTLEHAQERVLEIDEELNIGEQVYDRD